MTCPICATDKRLVIYEDNEVFAYLSDRPATKGHIIVAPKKHIPIFEVIPDELLSKLFLAANRLSTVLFEALGALGTNIIVHNGIPAGQKDPHFQVNVIPRFENDGLNLAWEPKKLSEDVLGDIEKRLKAEPEEQVPELQPDDEENYLIKSLDRVP